MKFFFTKVEGSIELRDVTFSYPSRPDTPVFQNSNLTIQDAKSIAKVGSSGCGKSALVSLIEMIYDPTSGNYLSHSVLFTVFPPFCDLTIS